MSWCDSLNVVDNDGWQGQSLYCLSVARTTANRTARHKHRSEAKNRRNVRRCLALNRKWRSSRERTFPIPTRPWALTTRRFRSTWLTHVCVKALLPGNAIEAHDVTNYYKRILCYFQKLAAGDHDEAQSKRNMSPQRKSLVIPAQKRSPDSWFLQRTVFENPFLQCFEL